MATVLGFGTAVPATNFSQDELWKAWYADQPSPDWDAERTWFATTVKERHLAVDPFTEMSSEWPSTVRTARYLTEGLALGVEAAQKALAEAGVSASDVGLLAVASSTAPATQNPGLDVLIARELGIGRSARRLRLGPIGCHAALPLLSVGCDYADSMTGRRYSWRVRCPAFSWALSRLLIPSRWWPMRSSRMQPAPSSWGRPPTRSAP